MASSARAAIKARIARTSRPPHQIHHRQRKAFDEAKAAGRDHTGQTERAVRKLLELRPDVTATDALNAIWCGHSYELAARTLWQVRCTEEIHRAGQQVIPVFPTIHTELSVADPGAAM